MKAAGLPMWTRADEANLYRRVRQAAGLEPRKGDDGIHRVPTGQAAWCVRCKAGDHHASVPVGPYVICRCLGCLTLVVGS